jgi:hypothetical protein
MVLGFMIDNPLTLENIPLFKELVFFLIKFNPLSDKI